MGAKQDKIFCSERTDFITVIPYKFVEKTSCSTLLDEVDLREDDRGIWYV